MYGVMASYNYIIYIIYIIIYTIYIYNYIYIYIYIIIYIYIYTSTFRVVPLYRLEMVDSDVVKYLNRYNIIYNNNIMKSTKVQTLAEFGGNIGIFGLKTPLLA